MPKKFSSKSGSTIIEFNDEYLNTLSEGEHTIRVAFNNGGYAQTGFTIKKQEETVTPSNENEADITTNNPKTGDNIAIWISLSLASMVSFVGTKKVSRKKKRVNKH